MKTTPHSECGGLLAENEAGSHSKGLTTGDLIALFLDWIESPTPYLSPTYRPFSGVERTHVPQKALNENDLIKPKEIEAVFAAAEMDLDQFRRFGLDDTLERNGVEGCRRAEVYSNFADMLRCYYHTGDRIGELASCEVGDVLERTRQVVLGKHKRSRTQTNPTIRHITLNDEAFAIFDGCCEECIQCCIEMGCDPSCCLPVPAAKAQPQVCKPSTGCTSGSCSK